MTARLATLILLLAGCDTAIERPPSLSGQYTLWGALDPTQDVQSVRVVAVADTLVPQSASPLPVSVVSVDLATGTETAWRDTVVTFRNGSVGHIYRARFRPAFGSAHRVVVRRASDGGEVSATATVPPLARPLVRPVSLGAEGVRVAVLWPEAPQLNRVRVTYLVQDRSCATFALPLRLGASSGTSGPSGDGSEVLLNLTRAAQVLRALLTADVPVQIGLRAVTVEAEVASLDWRPPGNVFDFEALAAPGVFGNVVGGFGFVGGAYPAAFTFRPDPRDLARTTFIDTVSLCGDLPPPAAP